jgi:hypothetical protein
LRKSAGKSSSSKIERYRRAGSFPAPVELVRLRLREVHYRRPGGARRRARDRKASPKGDAVRLNDHSNQFSIKIIVNGQIIKTSRKPSLYVKDLSCMLFPDYGADFQ